MYVLGIMEQEEPKISLETLTSSMQDLNSMLFDEDKVNNEKTNGMAIDDAKFE